MTYQQFLNLPDSDKLVLFEIDKSVSLTDNLWIKEEGNIWKLRYSWQEEEVTFAYGFGSWGWGAYGSSGTATRPASTNNKVFNVKSIIADGIQLTENYNFDDLLDNEDSFLWEEYSQTIYIHTTGKSPDLAYSSIDLGISKGFSDKSIYLNNLYYDSRIKSIPNISTSRDSLFFGKISFEGGSVSLINTDGFFNSFGQDRYYGSECRIYFGSPDVSFEEFTLQYTGYVEGYSFESDTITINFKDNRKLLSSKIPQNEFSSIDYPGLVDDNNGIPLPLAYGSIKDGMAICITETVLDPTFTFKLADTTNHSIGSIDTVYVNNKSVAFSDVSLTDATFSLASNVYEPGDEVTADYTGYVDDNDNLIDTALPIIVDLLTTQTNIKYNSSYFNTTVWESLVLPQKIGILISEKEEIIDAISDISNSVLGLFIIEGDGRFNFKIVDSTVEIQDTIYIDSIITQPSVNLKSDEYINSVRIGWNRKWFSERFQYHTDKTKKEELFNNYRSNVEKDFNTLLSNTTDVSALATDIVDMFGGIFPTWTVTTKTQYIDLVVGDNVNLEVGKFENGVGKYIKGEIISKSIDFNNYSITFVIRYIESITPDIDIVELIKYKPSSSYQTGSVVSSDGSVWRALGLTLDNPPQPDSEFWDEFGKLYWFDYVQYNIGDIVNYNNFIWQATTSNVNSVPSTDNTDWGLFGNPTSVFNSSAPEGFFVYLASPQAGYHYNSVTPTAVTLPKGLYVRIDDTAINWGVYSPVNTGVQKWRLLFDSLGNLDAQTINGWSFS